MSLVTNNLLNFSRKLPAPFDKLTNKKVKVASKYSTVGEATLCATVIKAVNAVCSCSTGKEKGAVGIIDHRNVAEYKSSTGADTYHLVVYDKNTGAVLASVYDKNTEIAENYILPDRDGAAIIMAAFPLLMVDDEFRENFDAYFNQYNAGFPDIVKATESIAYMCDNVYRRVSDETCSAHVKFAIDRSGALSRVSQTQLDSGAFTPSIVVAGVFDIFAKTGTVKPMKKVESSVEHDDFVGKYELNKRIFTPLEQALIPKLPEWYIIPPEVIDICKHAHYTTAQFSPMRNFLLRGPAGTGKTMGAKAIAAGLNLPYMKYTCSAGSEIFDFIGQIFPETDNIFTTGNAQLEKERELLKSMGGINFSNVVKLMNLPDLEDMDYDPVGVFKTLTGMEKPEATSRDCMAIIMDRITKKVQELSKPVSNAVQGQTFTYIETDFLKALKNGYLVEIQEPSTIIQPGVLVGLNSLLEQQGSITLPTGEIIERHPDAVVVVTTNVSYEGCRGINQSVVDRMSLVRDVELPTQETMMRRAMSVTGETDEYQVEKMVQVVSNMAEFCRKNGITDGNVGMRSLIDWIVSSQITGDIYNSALYTVISKATSDEEDREMLISSVLEPLFAPGNSKKKIS